MVDALDEVWPKSSRNFWIEITESQLKFQKHQHDAIYPDPARVTFEVHSYCKPLSSASLNFQLMPILAHQGVPKGEFQRLLQEDINAKVDQLDTATDSPLSLRKWNQDNNLGSETIKQESIQTQAGLPSLNVERINWFIDVRAITQTVCYQCLHWDSTGLNQGAAIFSRISCLKQSKSTALESRIGWTSVLGNPPMHSWSRIL